MYRCIALIAALITVANTSLCWAQASSTRQFPQAALRGVVTFGEPPEVVLNGAAARLAPGARVRAANNALVLSGTLVGSKHTVHYTLEKTSGLIHNLWILRDDERAVTPWPTTPEHTLTWTFDPGTQTWTKP